MTEYCPICLMYENKSNFKTLSCGCSFCKYAVSEWVVAQLENYYKENFVLSCPKAILGHILSETDLKACLTPVQYEQYQMTSLKRLLLKNPQYRQCPMSQCNYLGWVDTNQKCTENLVCGKCNGKWNDPSLYPASNKFLNNFKSLLKGTNDYWSYIWKEIWVKYCPKCDSPIEKNGGCFHMTCQHCTYEFCWDCLQPYRNHKTGLCQVSVGYSWGLIILMIIGVIVRLCWINDIFSALIGFLLYKFILFFSGLLAFWLYFGTGCLICDYRRGYYMSFEKKIFIGMLILLCFLGIYFMYYFYSYFFEVFEIASILGVIFGTNFGACFILYKRY
ncbi:hypothetical protein SteCoe_26777 [Stentor coeruleus]|uniref:RBR-type E3 ubiquitin transferase n=1 Tax=Stentor coeruleus TaxID=5963 RepID=A0A1R2BC30_9CILI|nr:hypothetical protein SteCoe_26777 [Stentor coeruleus]